MSTKKTERHLIANMNLTKKQIITANFLGGLAWGLGSVIGAGVILAFVVWILKALGVFSAISSFFPQAYR